VISRVAEHCGDDERMSTSVPRGSAIGFANRYDAGYAGIDCRITHNG